MAIACVYFYAGNGIRQGNAVEAHLESDGRPNSSRFLLGGGTGQQNEFEAPFVTAAENS
jgi:hypothetical protein